MNKYLYIVLLMALSNISHAQLINNRYNIYFSCSFGNFLGSETIDEDNYITPSLFSNYNNLSGFSIKGFINCKEYLSYGINYEFQSANEWTSSNYSDFDGSKIELHSIAPLIRIHNKFKEKGLSNKLLLFFECGPSIVFSNFTISKPLFEIQTNEYYLKPPMSDNNCLAGLKGTIGIDYTFIQSLGFFLSYSYSIDWVSSKLYNDNTIKSSLINVGLVMKFNKNKYFYY